MRSLVEELGLKEQVDVVGEVRYVPSHLARRTDVVAIPSQQPDPLPTIAIEAMRASQPVIESRLGGLPEMIDRGKSGFLIPAENVEAWRKALLDISRADLTPMGAASRSLYDSRFTSQAYRRRLAHLVLDPAWFGK